MVYFYEPVRNDRKVIWTQGGFTEWNGTSEIIAETKNLLIAHAKDFFNLLHAENKSSWEEVFEYLKRIFGKNIRLILYSGGDKPAEECREWGSGENAEVVQYYPYGIDDSDAIQIFIERIRVYESTEFGWIGRWHFSWREMCLEYLANASLKLTSESEIISKALCDIFQEGPLCDKEFKRIRARLPCATVAKIIGIKKEINRIVSGEDIKISDLMERLVHLRSVISCGVSDTF